MNRFLKKISFDEIEHFIKKNKQHFKTAALPLVISLAVLFFWIYGSGPAGTSQSEGFEETGGESDLISEESANYSEHIFIDISGAVYSPGVYEVEPGTRLFKVVEMAGGFMDGYNPDIINQAEEVFDGQKIIIPFKSDAAGDESTYENENTPGISNGKVNLNLAGPATLQTIPGIGPSKAERIIEYRESVGKFRKIEEIMNITGIGEKTFESIRDYITV